MPARSVVHYADSLAQLTEENVCKEGKNQGQGIRINEQG